MPKKNFEEIYAKILTNKFKITLMDWYYDVRLNILGLPSPTLVDNEIDLLNYNWSLRRILKVFKFLGTKFYSINIKVFKSLHIINKLFHVVH